MGVKNSQMYIQTKTSLRLEIIARWGYLPINMVLRSKRSRPVPIAQVVERPLREREVAGSKPGRAIPKALKMVPVATLLGAQHYKASTGFFHSLLTQLTLHTQKNTNPQHLVHRNPSDVPLGG